jgi:hypothetical protein
MIEPEGLLEPSSTAHDKRRSSGWNRFIIQWQKDFKLWLFFIAFFLLFRCAFIFLFRHQIDASSNYRNIVAALSNGLRYDSVFTTCLLTIPLVFSIISGFANTSHAGNTLLSRKFAEKVAQTVPDSARLGTLDDHGALLFHLGRRVEYLEVTNANKFLENANHYLIVHKESDLQQIDEKLRRIIVSGIPYRNLKPAYLLQGRQLQDNSGLK